MYSAEYYTKDQFPLLRKDWNRLEKGIDMTAYQSYAWYEMLNKIYVPQDTKDYISVYILIKRNGQTILVAPFWIILHTFKIVNKKGIYFLGRSSWSDYLNFIYDEFDSEAIVYLLRSVAEKYRVNRLYLESLKQNSQSFQSLLQQKNSKELGVGISVSLTLPKTQEDFKTLLSKNTRQNIRTAHNRQKKDGINISVVFDDQCVNRDKCWEIREERFVEKFKKIPLLKQIKYNIMRRLTFQFPSFLPFYTFADGHFLTTYDGDTLCSFFYYILDKYHRQVIVIAAGVNSNYSRYSPGFVSLFELINYHISIGDVDTFDFGLGDEMYKYNIGGKNQPINGIIAKG
jgi:CelD/BcsL family acetyltransferase involved in cellulose biosynthesis